MRWIPVEVFTDGEPNPYPPGRTVLRRRVRAIPIIQRPSRTWFFDAGGAAQWQPLRERRTGAVVGYAWVRRSAVLWRRAAWALWLLAGVAAFVHVAVDGGLDERVVLISPGSSWFWGWLRCC